MTLPNEPLEVANMSSYALNLVILFAAPVITAAFFLWQYFFKLKSQRRLSEACEIESHVKLLTLFTELMNIAHGRSGYLLSEKAVEHILRSDEVRHLPINELLSSNTLQGAMVTLPVGTAAQDAAIAAIYELGRKYDILKQPAQQALETLATFKPSTTEKYLKR